MLYASSANTLHRELGGHERFGSTLFWTDLDEVSAKGWHSHIAHENAPAPKTEDEQSLEDIAEVEAKQMGTLNVKSHVLSSTVSLPVNEDATAAIKQLAQSAGSAAAALVCSFL
jgi:twinfilin-like protein